MWLVVYKQPYYPSVFECETKTEAEKLYKEILEREFTDIHDSEYVNDIGKVYITEVVENHGTNNDDVDWYLNIR